MSLLWAVPPVAVATALVIVLMQIREIADASGDLAIQLRRLAEVRVAVADVRAESSRARATLQHLRSR